MSVEFHEPEFAPVRQAESAKSSYLTSLVIRSGLAKDAASAQRVMLMIIGACVLFLLGWWLLTIVTVPVEEVPPDIARLTFILAYA